ncbi:MAG: type II toxin-antitoxin system VapC family toxin [Bifidobacteriaceae bacterium]|jgi:predicted nucleic acid-binding protein|nr:type II toxin-antitoxin system VapC family toxin [Bifidobacteriaceae bacterium]
MVYYVDTSALVKLLVAEDGSDRAQAIWAGMDGCPASSAIAWTELLRAVREQGPVIVSRARRLLESLDLITVDHAILDRAASLDPAIMRSLDAIHLACALALGDDLEAVVTFDTRMARAAQVLGLPALGCQL